MKKSIFYSIMLAIICIACEPSEDRQSPGGAITADQLEVSATPVVVNGKNSNKIILENRSPVLSQWDFGNGTSTRSYDEVLLVVTGNTNIIFTGLNADGSKITKEIPVTVEELSFDVPAEWGYLCGEGSKEWGWDTAAGNVFGNGEHITHSTPAWWVLDTNAVEEQVPGEGTGAYMIFSISGAKLTKVLNTGAEQQGTFSFDMSETETDGDGNPYVLGKLSTNNVTVLAGVSLNEDQADIYKYSILKINNEELVLSYDRYNDVDDFQEGWFWMFRAR
ncbi:MAG: hypothetical protein LUG51_02140 [Tannerellaceae bacterium]|nr:hypothetical protein [Tannerellaceae bacterium]